MFHHMHGWGMGPWFGPHFGFFFFVLVLIAIAVFCLWRAGVFGDKVTNSTRPTEEKRHQQEDTMKLLLQLHELKEKGAISDEEYTAKKGQLLDRL